MEDKPKGIVLRGVALLLLILGAAAFFRFCLPALLPFLVSYVISAGIRPLSCLLSKKTPIPKKLWAVLFIILSVSAVSALFWFLGSTLAREVEEAVSTLGSLLSDGESPLRKTGDKMMGMLQRVNVFGEEYSFNVGEVLSGAISSLTSAAASRLGALVSGAPSFIFFVVVMILSLYYFSCDFERIKREAARFLPEGVIKTASEWSEIALRALGRFARAYLSLFSITFGVLCVGFFLIGVDYPLLAALLSAFVDLLPVFGVGTVLVPWAVVLFLTGEAAKGWGMLILLLFMYVLRQIIEPKLVGDAMGVHPVLVLFAVFLGFKLAGVGGMIAAPLIVNGLFAFLDEKKKKMKA